MITAFLARFCLNSHLLALSVMAWPPIQAKDPADSRQGWLYLQSSFAPSGNFQLERQDGEDKGGDQYYQLWMNLAALQTSNRVQPCVLVADIGFLGP